MPVEYTILRNKPRPKELRYCPHCFKLFKYFWRGCIRKNDLAYVFELLVSKVLGRKPFYCALICDECKEIVGYENIDGDFKFLRKHRGK